MDLRHLEDRWDERAARDLDGPELLRYRSNLLGSDLRITNFGGGNTSAKLVAPDPLDGQDREVLWVKGSGGDLGSISRAGFATLYLDKLHALRERYRGRQPRAERAVRDDLLVEEDEMVELYPLCTFGKNPVAASIDTPLHAFLPFAHVDHLHPDWGIALAAAANGRERMEDFNRRFGHRMVWVPWHRPGFELAMVLRRAVDENPGCDGIVLGGHGLFTWGDSSRDCYRRSLTVIDHLGQLVGETVSERGPRLFGGARCEPAAARRELATEILPFVRGRVSQKKRLIGHFSDDPDVLRFVCSREAAALAHLGTSCPDHFVRTKIRPLFVDWDPSAPRAELRPRFEAALAEYRESYRRYYHSFATKDSPPLRDPNPTVVLIPGVGMLSFGKSKAEARITGEFYTNAIHVMEGATSLGTGAAPGAVSQAGLAAEASAFTVHENYVALPASEAFGIEYWQLEEAKLRRQPPEKELSRWVVVVVGGAAGIGRATALLAAERGAHVVVADRDLEGASRTCELARKLAGREGAIVVEMDIRDRGSIRRALEETVAAYGGIDVLINTAAIFLGAGDDETWATTLDINVTANHRLVDEAARFLRDQDLEACVVLTSSANAVVAKRGSEPYDVSKAAVSHLVRELAVSLAPKIRVNGVSPATVIAGSTMFPRRRVMASLAKYDVPFDETMSDDELRALLAGFYARRTLTHESVLPEDCARAALFLAGPQARCTTGHLVPVDGGLTDAFLR
jgi:rhamnose utilization protein RhaD (predicted bifunctional aldolase and dehydrogenase)/NAD(P)-dependent dehydrogenase (short-subunit alcohol dehydrogenase family)